MTVSKERIKGDDLIPTHGPADNQGRKQSIIKVWLPGAGCAGLSAVDAQQENHGRTTPSAAAMEKSNHPTDLLW